MHVQAEVSYCAKALPALAAWFCAEGVVWLQSLHLGCNLCRAAATTLSWPVIMLFLLQGRVDPESFLLVAEPEARANSFVGTEEYLAPEVRIQSVKQMVMPSGLLVLWSSQAAL